MEDRLLLLFSIAFIAWAGAAIVVPYVRRKTDLLTARNFFLVGSAFYVGFSGIKAATEGHHFPYSSKVFLIYYAYIVVFFVTFELAYRKIRWPSRMASRHFLQWPPQEGPGLWFPMACMFATTSLQVILIQIPGLAPLLVRIGMLGPTFALVFALAIWSRGKMNPLAISAVVCVFFLGAYMAFSTGGGRRFLYSLALAGPCCFYWWVLRYKHPMTTLASFAVLAMLWPIGDTAYRAARWVGAREKTETVGAAARWQVFKDALFQRTESFGESTLQIGQGTVENSLLTVYIFHEARGQFPEIYVKPFHTLYVIGTLPIPRVFWEDKPKALGVTLPYDSGILNQYTGRTNWGPGIVAHSMHDGGIFVAIIYAVIFAVGLRYIDELLVRHPGNPFLMGFLSASSVQITGLVRGDISGMAPLIILCFIFMVLALWATRMVVGVESPARGMRGMTNDRLPYGRFPTRSEFLPHEGAAQ